MSLALHAALWQQEGCLKVRSCSCKHRPPARPGSDWKRRGMKGVGSEGKRKGTWGEARKERRNLGSDASVKYVVAADSKHASCPTLWWVRSSHLPTSGASVADVTTPRAAKPTAVQS
eukprot:CAMPEP_0206540792 /NCGR_PEP_ID=MMETSP0325_2-20121206/9220_1 /ASSEMBLY_ACC=CAM_ASM_000347 /TAXON_ID=2866 /ORGANISM="Crypthecodinium cohnii, Strain Seligo" /LENGTH=116 /DNA_ID=CAMNT_0054038591 /DNA_START=224 /DNA_END=574 /DNA_ORIENTATION=+